MSLSLEGRAVETSLRTAKVVAASSRKGRVMTFYQSEQVVSPD